MLEKHDIMSFLTTVTSPVLKKLTKPVGKFCCKARSLDAKRFSYFLNIITKVPVSLWFPVVFGWWQVSDLNI